MCYDKEQKVRRKFINVYEFGTGNDINGKFQAVKKGRSITIGKKQDKISDMDSRGDCCMFCGNDTVIGE